MDTLELPDDIFKLLGFRYYFSFRDYTIFYTGDRSYQDNPELCEITEKEFHSFLELRKEGYTFKRDANGKVEPIPPVDDHQAAVLPVVAGDSNE